MWRSRAVSGNAIPNGPVMSRPWAQCSASLVVARVAGFNGAAAQVKTRPGSADRRAATDARRAARQRERVGGRRPFGLHPPLDGAVQALVADAPVGSTDPVVAGGDRGHDRLLGLGQVQHDVGHGPPGGARLGLPLRRVERREDRLEPVLLGDEVVEDLHGADGTGAALSGPSPTAIRDRRFRQRAYDAATREREVEMPKYLLQVNYTLDGVKGVLAKGGSARRAAAQAAVESVGGSLESMYFAFGGTDALAIVDVADNAAAAALALTVSASGGATANTVVLLTPEEIDTAAGKGVQYTPPGQ